MKLKEALTFWADVKAEATPEDQPVVIDAESIPGWVIALRCPRNRAPYVEIWWEDDFIVETQIHQAIKSKVD